MPKRRIRKSAEVVAAEPAPAEIHELTNITVEEVSMVDRPANERKFLLRKAKEKAEAAAKAAELPVPELVAEPAEEIDLVAAAKAMEDLKAKDAEDLAKKKAEESAQVSDPAAALTDLVAATKTDVTVETAEGAITVSIPDEPARVPAAPPELIDKVKTATLAGIDAIAARVASFRSAVETGAPSPYSSSGTSDVLWDHVYYIKGMLEALYDIGGPSWEIESAGDAASDVDKSGVAKAGHKSITASRVAKLAAIHKGMTYCMKDYAGIMKELSQEQDEEGDLEVDPTTAGTELTGKNTPPIAKAAPVVAPAPVIVAPDPVVLNKLNELTAMITTLKGTVAEQAVALAKARNSNGGSNALSVDEVVANDVPNTDTNIWPADMAPQTNIKKRRF